MLYNERRFGPIGSSVLVFWVLLAYSIHAFFICVGYSGNGFDNIGAVGFSFLEALFFLSVLYLLVMVKNYIRFLSDIIFVVIISSLFLVYSIQTYSYVLSGSYLTVLALENSTETRFLDFGALFGLISVGAVFIGGGYFIFRKIDNSSFNKGLSVFLLFISGFIYFVVWINSSYPAGNISLNWNQAPIASLTKSFLALERQRETLLKDVEAMSRNDKVSEYPLQKSWVYKSGSPYEISGHNETPNVIVIFSEGVSSRLLSVYGGPEDLMPNISKFAQSSLVIDGYYNHTAATFRGLQGQMTSGYPFVGGNMEGGWANGGNSQFLRLRRYSSVPDILSQKGYETLFFSPHKDTNPLNDMLRSLGFEDVFSFGYLTDRFKKESKREDMLDDEALFGSLEKFLAEREDTEKPFFAATYNIGTHAFFDVVSDSNKYKNGDNQVLNRVHNFDRVVGKFLDWFERSDYRNNTILILTSDHATYPEPDYVEFAESTEYKPYFVDKIPFIIYSPIHDFPTRKDVGSRSSVDFAPTLLHLLGINGVDNSFLGHSLFDSEYASDLSFAAIGHSFFQMERNGITKGSEMGNKPGREQIDRFVRSVKYYYALEEVGRVFDKK